MVKEVKATWKMANGKEHFTFHSFEKTDLYCLICGTQGLWREVGEGDFYSGQQHICVHCRASFRSHGVEVCQGDESIIEQLKGEC